MDEDDEIGPLLQQFPFLDPDSPKRPDPEIQPESWVALTTVASLFFAIFARPPDDPKKKDPKKESIIETTRSSFLKCCAHYVHHPDQGRTTFVPFFRSLFHKYGLSESQQNFYETAMLTTFPEPLNLAPPPSQSQMDRAMAAHRIWTAELQRQAQLKADLAGITKTTQGFLQTQADLYDSINHVAKEMFSHKDQDQKQRRVLRMATDLIFAIDDMAMDDADMDAVALGLIPPPVRGG
jgi:hypothetical protein